jgi:hypothetical protein
MKSISPITPTAHVSALSLICFGIVVQFSQGQTSTRPPMLVAPTNEQLIVKLKESDQQTQPSKASKLSSAVDPATGNEPQGLIESSEILCYGGVLTLVPKRAVLQIPKNLANRLKEQPNIKIVNWDEFYAANRNWITTVEVNREQAEGKQSLPKDMSLSIVKSGNVVIATCEGNPVSVLPAKVSIPLATPPDNNLNSNP